MEITIIFIFFIFFLIIYFQVSTSKLKLIQRIKLIEAYTELYFYTKVNYKCKETPIILQKKEDFLFFKNAFTWLVPYIKLKKQWSTLSDWDFGMLVQHIITATDKYPNSKLAQFVEQNFLLDIMTRSVILLFPSRINLFMHLKNNKEDKCMVGDLDFTVIKKEMLALKGIQQDYTKKEHIKHKPNIEVDYIYYLKNLKNLIKNISLNDISFKFRPYSSF